VPATPSLRILLVDDSVDASASLAALLELRGHRVALAYDGASALQLVDDSHPDVVLLDISLPDMSGCDVARQIRTKPELGTILLIALTGYGTAADRASTRDAGFDHHFTKPLDFPRPLAGRPAPAQPGSGVSRH
jgi:two-component system, OmpR family, response regulator